MNDRRCEICWKFIWYNDDCKVDYTPDTDLTIEEFKFTHKKCLWPDTHN